MGSVTWITAAVERATMQSSPRTAVYGESASTTVRMPLACRKVKLVLIVERDAEIVSDELMVVMGVVIVLMI